MNSEKSGKDKDSEKFYRKESNEVGLSEEARLSEEERENIRSLGNNRYLISASSVNEEKVQEELGKEGKEESRKELKEGISDGISGDSGIEEADEEKAEEIAELVMSKLEGKDLPHKNSKGEDKVQEVDNKHDVKSNPLKDPLNLVKLLSTYHVSLDSSVKDLIKNIKDRGEDHIVEEIDKMEGG